MPIDKFKCMQQKVDACEGDGEMIAKVLAGERETCKMCMECFPTGTVQKTYTKR
jgi:hypothetical protein